MVAADSTHRTPFSPSVTEFLSTYIDTVSVFSHSRTLWPISQWCANNKTEKTEINQTEVKNPNRRSPKQVIFKKKLQISNKLLHRATENLFEIGVNLQWLKQCSSAGQLTILAGQCSRALVGHVYRHAVHRCRQVWRRLLAAKQPGDWYRVRRLVLGCIHRQLKWHSARAGASKWRRGRRRDVWRSQSITIQPNKPTRHGCQLYCHARCSSRLPNPVIFSRYLSAIFLPLLFTSASVIHPSCPDSKQPHNPHALSHAPNNIALLLIML